MSTGFVLHWAFERNPGFREVLRQQMQFLLCNHEAWCYLGWHGYRSCSRTVARYIPIRPERSAIAGQVLICEKLLTYPPQIVSHSQSCECLIKNYSWGPWQSRDELKLDVWGCELSASSCSMVSVPLLEPDRPYCYIWVEIAASMTWTHQPEKLKEAVLCSFQRRSCNSNDAESDLQ